MPTSESEYQRVVAELKASKAHLGNPGNRSEAESIAIVVWLMATSVDRPLRPAYAAAGARAERLRERIKALPAVSDALLDELTDIRGALPRPATLGLDPTLHTPQYIERVLGRLEAAIERAASR